MKALLRKDFYELITSLRMIFPIMAVFFIVGILSSNSLFVVPYLVVMPAAMGSSVITLEEQVKWSGFCGTLPVTRTVTVVEKYVFCCSLAVCGSILAAGCNLVYILRGIQQTGFFALLLQFLAIGLLVPSILLPCTFYFGSQKGRYVMILIIVVTTLLILERSKDGPAAVLPAGVAPAVYLLAAAVILVLSCLLSIRIWKKKEITG